MKKELDVTMYDATDEQICKFVYEVTAGRLSKPNYYLSSILETIKDVSVSKSDMNGFYFDDILNTCSTYEEVVDYIKSIKWFE